MLARGMSLNQLIVTNLLSACACLGAAKLGELIIFLVYKFGINSCLSVCIALITMYFNVWGSLDGLCAFEKIPDRDIVTWNAVLGGCAQNGLGIFPNKINFLGVLCACGHAGFLDKGWAYFNFMSECYGIIPLVYHYTCMVDLHGRAGRISEAVALIQNIQIYMHLKVCGTHFLK